MLGRLYKYIIYFPVYSFLKSISKLFAFLYSYFASHSFSSIAFSCWQISNSLFKPCLRPSAFSRRSLLERFLRSEINQYFASSENVSYGISTIKNLVSGQDVLLLGPAVPINSDLSRYISQSSVVFTHNCDPRFAGSPLLLGKSHISFCNLSSTTIDSNLHTYTSDKPIVLYKVSEDLFSSSPIHSTLAFQRHMNGPEFGILPYKISGTYTGSPLQLSHLLISVLSFRPRRVHLIGYDFYLSSPTQVNNRPKGPPTMLVHDFLLTVEYLRVLCYSEFFTDIEFMLDPALQRILNSRNSDLFASFSSKWL